MKTNGARQSGISRLYVSGYMQRASRLCALSTKDVDMKIPGTLMILWRV